MSGRRTLIVHAGGGKAGSSAIQSVLGQAAGELSELGITYAHAPDAPSPYSVTSGNGLVLYQRLMQPDFQEVPDELIESFLGKNKIGICSSEFLGSMPELHWRRLMSVTDKLAIDLKIVFFVRPAVDYVVASYNQDVKRGGESRSFEAAASDISWQHFEDLKTLGSLFDRNRLKVINYDLARRDIVGALIDAYGELRPAETSLRKVPRITVNRSLTSEEIDVMRQVNERLDRKFGEELSDRLIYDEPEVASHQLVAEETLKILAGKFEDATSWINERYFSEASGALALRPSSAPRAKRKTSRADRTLRVALEWALERLREVPHSSLSFIRERLLAIDWHNANHPLIPRDFDPIAYLLINFDVMKAELPPYIHFIQSGHAEQRSYRWPLSLDLIDGKSENEDEAIARLCLDDLETQAQAPVWPRLRHFFQLEGLLHRFAERECSYLEEIRRLRERQGFENEQIKQGAEEAVLPLRSLMQDTSAQLAAATSALAQSAKEQFFALESQSEKLVGEILALRDGQMALNKSIDARDSELARLNGILEYKDGERARLEAALDKRDAEMARLNAIAEKKDVEQSRLNAIIEQKEAEQTRLNAIIEQRDAKLAEQGELLRRYRQYGFFKFLKWGLWRDTRP